jgi:membrane protein DedA with SNARE-associated domain
MDYLAIQILAFVKANPGWAMFIIGLTAFGESFVFLSLLFPGTAILIAAATLVSEGILSPLPTVVAGIAGAVLGDSVSFWLGQKFGPLLPKIWPFRMHPERLTRGSAFLSAMVLAAFSSGDSLGRYARLFPWRLA